MSCEPFSHLNWSVLSTHAEFQSAERLLLATVDMWDYAAWQEGCGRGPGRQKMRWTTVALESRWGAGWVASHIRIGCLFRGYIRLFAHSLTSAIIDCIKASKPQFSKHVWVSFQRAIFLGFCLLLVCLQCILGNWRGLDRVQKNSHSYTTQVLDGIIPIYPAWHHKSYLSIIENSPPYYALFISLVFFLHQFLSPQIHCKALYTSRIFIPKRFWMGGNLVYIQPPTILSNTLSQKYTSMMKRF
jgi:hypothetical protein